MTKNQTLLKTASEASYSEIGRVRDLIDRWMEARFPGVDYRQSPPKQGGLFIDVYETFNGAVIEGSRHWRWKNDRTFGWIYWTV